MANNYFQFKQFKINQSRAAMKVGTDGVLLGAWASCSGAQRILDIGTGTGLIALMLAQRYTAMIDALEIDEAAMADAKENIQQSPWSERIKLYPTALQHFSPAEKYDALVSNPPYFKDSLKAPDAARTRARHSDTLSLEELVVRSVKLLQPAGKLHLVLPYEALEELQIDAAKAGLYLVRICRVKPTPSKSFKRVLLTLAMQADPCVEEELILEEFGRHQYSQAYKDLTRDFYLNF